MEELGEIETNRKTERGEGAASSCVTTDSKTRMNVSKLQAGYFSQK